MVATPLLEHHWLICLGEAGYGVYILQGLPRLLTIDTAVAPTPIPALALMGIIGCAGLTYHYVEMSARRALLSLLARWSH